MLGWINVNNIVIVQNSFLPQKLVKIKLTTKINYFIVGKFNLKSTYMHFQSHKFTNTTNIYTYNLNLTS